MSQPQYPPPQAGSPQHPGSAPYESPDGPQNERPYEPPYHPYVTYQQVPAQPFQMAPTPPPKKRFPGWLVGLGVVFLVLVLGCVGAFVLLGFGAKSVSETITNDQKATMSDASVASCTTEAATGFMTATVAITNHGSDQASYLVDVAFESTDGTQQFDSGVATAEDLAAGQSTRVEAGSLKAPKGHFACKITSVTRI